jgi:hypothetical protein
MNDRAARSTVARKRIAWSMVALLTVGGILSAYQMLFALWMTAYPMVDASIWRPRVYFRLALTLVIGLLWSSLVVWLFRHRRSV